MKKNVTWKYKMIQTFPPQASFGHSLYHSNTNLARIPLKVNKEKFSVRERINHFYTIHRNI